MGEGLRVSWELGAFEKWKWSPKGWGLSQGRNGLGLVPRNRKGPLLAHTPGEEVEMKTFQVCGIKLQCWDADGVIGGS
jgi:hypothetical protein